MYLYPHGPDVGAFIQPTMANGHVAYCIVITQVDFTREEGRFKLFPNVEAAHDYFSKQRMNPHPITMPGIKS